MSEVLEPKEQEDVRIIFLGDENLANRLKDEAFNNINKEKIEEIRDNDYKIRTIYINEKKVNLGIHFGITNKIKNSKCKKQAVVYVFDFEEERLYDKIDKNFKTVQDYCSNAIEALIFIITKEKKYNKEGLVLNGEELKNIHKSLDIQYMYSLDNSLFGLDDCLKKIIQEALNSNGCCDCCLIN